MFGMVFGFRLAASQRCFHASPTTTSSTRVSASNNRAFSASRDGILAAARVRVHDALTNQEIEMNDQTIWFPLPSSGWRVVRLRP